ncbi:uncharacterized protein EV420DRAFT_1142361 [Desarmillaria tabescens]|uniref:DUF6535 domain-containing protein n=1 Tax=Armillaria tabescens TaxID=1929756 RepID=A0AA39NC27_ARMTA|nr:uncharacterized protein EV420DRAFT_1142361 [Desarmillaria tabescens]KAK0462872.1 hypothetical protein EV420DRAFT_1142361 [Desarmillaria tabescens]
MVEDPRYSVDVLLVFESQRRHNMSMKSADIVEQAGLFSAVVTTFAVQASQNLRLDFVEVSSSPSLLFELVFIQRAVASGASMDSVPESRTTLVAIFDPTGMASWVNGLWFISFSPGLVIAALVKKCQDGFRVLSGRRTFKGSSVRSDRV